MSSGVHTIPSGETAKPVDGIRRHAVLLEAVESNDAATASAALKEHGELTYLHLESIC